MGVLVLIGCSKSDCVCYTNSSDFSAGTTATQETETVGSGLTDEECNAYDYEETVAGVYTIKACELD